MTKLNLKELRADCESDGVAEFRDDRVVNFRTVLPLLDWIERAKDCFNTKEEVTDMPTDFCKTDCECYRCKAKKLLAELEE